MPHGAEFRFHGHVADDAATAAELVHHLGEHGLVAAPTDTPGSWRVDVADAATAEAARVRVADALRDASADTRTCLAVSVRGY